MQSVCTGTSQSRDCDLPNCAYIDRSRGLRPAAETPRKTDQERWLRPEAAAAWAKAAFLLVSAAAMVHAADHSVGGASNGWTKPNGNTLPVTYLQDWASAQSFSRGDRLLFDYSPVAHNVLVVSLADYVICNTLSPIAKYVSWKDTVTVPAPAGPSYYICGTPTHCESGQKFNITAASTAPNSGAGVYATVSAKQTLIAATIAIVATTSLW